MLSVTTEDNIILFKNAYARSLPSVNIHLARKGTYYIDVYADGGLDFDFTLHVYAAAEPIPILNQGLGENDVSEQWVLNGVE